VLNHTNGLRQVLERPKDGEVAKGLEIYNRNSHDDDVVLRLLAKDLKRAKRKNAIYLGVKALQVGLGLLGIVGSIGCLIIFLNAKDGGAMLVIALEEAKFCADCGGQLVSAEPNAGTAYTPATSSLSFSIPLWAQQVLGAILNIAGTMALIWLVPRVRSYDVLELPLGYGGVQMIPPMTIGFCLGKLKVERKAVLLTSLISAGVLGLWWLVDGPLPVKKYSIYNSMHTEFLLPCILTHPVLMLFVSGFVARRSEKI